MTYLMRCMVGILLTTITSLVFALSTGDATILKASNQWAQAIDSRDPHKIAALYAKDAILYATFTDYIDTQSGILKYFVNLTKNQDLKVTFTKQNIRLFGKVAIDSGMYIFSYTADGKKVEVPARFTFVYQETPKGWMIIDHHSSETPEK